MTNKPLTDAQRVVLSHASMEADGAVLPMPRSTRLNSGAVGVLLHSLWKQAFVRERPAGRDDISWREIDGGNRVTLVISDEGCEAIGVDVIGTGPAKCKFASNSGSDSLSLIFGGGVVLFSKGNQQHDEEFGLFVPDAGRFGR